MQGLLLFLGYLLVTLLWSQGVEPSQCYDYIRYALLIFMFVVLVAWVDLVTDGNWLRWLLYLLAPLAFGVLLYSALVFYSEHPFPASRLSNLVFYRHNPNSNYAYVLLALLGLQWWLTDSSKRLTYLGAGSMVTAAAALVLSQSRTLLLGTVVGSLVLLLGFRRWRCLAVGCGLLLLGVVGLEVANWGVQGLIERGDSYRLDIWALAWQRIAEQPLLGAGIVTEKRFYVAGVYHCMHNVWLLVALMGGVMGVMLFALLVLTAVRAGWQGWHRRQLGSYFAGAWGLTGLVMTNTAGVSACDLLANVGSYYWPTLWLPLGLLVAQELKTRQGLQQNDGSNSFAKDQDKLLSPLLR